MTILPNILCNIYNKYIKSIVSNLLYIHFRLFMISKNFPLLAFCPGPLEGTPRAAQCHGRAVHSEQRISSANGLPASADVSEKKKKEKGFSGGGAAGTESRKQGAGDLGGRGIGPL